MRDTNHEEFILYVLARNNLSEIADRNGEVETVKAREKLCYTRFPKKIHQIIFKEMQKLGLIEIINRKKIKILNVKCAG